MDPQEISNITFGLASSQYAAPKAIVVWPHEFRLLNEDGDDVLGPVPGVAYYNKLASPVPHGWQFGRLDGISKMTFSSDRNPATAERDVPENLKLSQLVGVGDALSLISVTKGTARVEPASLRGPDEPVLFFTNSDDGLDYAIPTERILTLCSDIQNATAES